MEDASWLAAAMVSAAESGSSTEPRISTSNDPRTAPLTRTTYRTLILKGLAPDEASNLTAFLCGIPIGTQHWKIAEVNQLLFLRALHETGRFGPTDGAIASR